jgi:hypothetical protein
VAPLAQARHSTERGAALITRCVQRLEDFLLSDRVSVLSVWRVQKGAAFQGQYAEKWIMNTS